MRVILVDDEPEVLDHLQYHMSLVPRIKDVAVYTEPLNALNHVREKPVDVAFLDIEIYGMNGIELAKHIKDIRPEVSIVFVTGYGKYALDAFRIHASDYLLKPATVDSIKIALDNLRRPAVPDAGRIRIQTFGNFGVFVNGKPLHITCSRAKELLALLVDKRGVPVTKAQIAAVLWEDKEYSRSMQKRTQEVIAQMMKVLSSAGIEDIVNKDRNSFSVNVSKFVCDYYQFLEGDIFAVNTYSGEYMNEYSWAEMTAGILTHKK